jgi:hypothetical protein
MRVHPGVGARAESAEDPSYTHKFGLIDLLRYGGEILPDSEQRVFQAG